MSRGISYRDMKRLENEPSWSVQCDFCGRREFESAIETCDSCLRKYCDQCGEVWSISIDGARSGHLCRECLDERREEACKETGRDPKIRPVKPPKRKYDAGEILECTMCGQRVPEKDALCCEKEGCGKALCPDCKEKERQAYLEGNEEYAAYQAGLWGSPFPGPTYCPECEWKQAKNALAERQQDLEERRRREKEEEWEERAREQERQEMLREMEAEQRANDWDSESSAEERERESWDEDAEREARAECDSCGRRLREEDLEHSGGRSLCRACAEREEKYEDRGDSDRDDERDEENGDGDERRAADEKEFHLEAGGLGSYPSSYGQGKGGTASMGNLGGGGPGMGNLGGGGPGMGNVGGFGG